jgi:hypothetical protein
MRWIRGFADRTEYRTRLATLGPWLWFSFVALAVAAPLLGAGYLLLLDYPSGPALPHVPLLPLPRSGDVGNGTPLLALEALLRHIQVWLPDKVFLLAPIVLGGVGLYRLVRSRFGVDAAAATYGATLFVLNPFVADRYLAGHLFFLLALALLPWALGPLLDLADGSKRSGVRVGLWLFGLAVIDLHVAGMYALLVVVAGVTAWSRKGSIDAAVGLGLGAVLCAYWVIPSLLASPGRRVGAADLAVYASRPSGVRVLPRLMGLYGFWREEFAGPAQRIPVLYLLLVPIVGLAITGALSVLGSNGRRRAGIPLVVTAVIALLLAGGISFPPTAGAFRFVFDHVPFFRIYREPQKFLALVVLAYAVFGAVGLESVVGRRPTVGSARAWGASALAIGVAGTYAYTMLWGFWGEVHLSRYPADWEHAEQIMDAHGEGRVLVLPWNLYAIWSFTEGRIVANPAPSFFTRQVTAGDNVGFSRIPTQSVDPFSGFVEDILRHRGRVRELGHLLAPLDVRFVLLLHEADPGQYVFVRHQADLVSLFIGPRLELFENLAWRGSVLPLGPASSSPSALDEAGKVTEQLFPAKALGPQGGTGVFGWLARLLPGWRSIPPAGAQYVATGDRCTDGSRLGDRAPICHMGAVAAFPSPGQAETLWRPPAGARLIGLLIGGLTLIGSLFYVRTKPTRGRATAHEAETP